MAISVGLITAGLGLVNTIINHVWSSEETGNDGRVKKEAVMIAAKTYMVEHGIVVDNTGDFIDAFIDLLNEYDFFSVEG